MCRALRERVAGAGTTVRRLVRVCTTSCLDSCATGPNVVLGHDQRLRTGLVLGEVGSFLDFVVGGVTNEVDRPASGGRSSPPPA